MELAYFISGCSNPSALRDHWDYSKKDTSGAFIRTKSLQLSGISGNDDFSIFFAFDKAEKGAGSLLSNWNGTSGYFIGFNDDNQLFVATSTPVPYSFYFPEIELGQKNCLAITKEDSLVSVYRYDLKAKKIHSTYSKEFDSDTLLSGKKFLLGYDSTVFSKYKISGVSGTFDQFACFNKAFGREDVNIIFSGFLPIQRADTTLYSRYYYKDSYEEIKNPNILENYIASGFTGFLNYLSGSFPTVNGVYSSLLTGITDYANNRIFWSGYYYEEADIGCAPTGIRYAIGGTYQQYTLDVAESDEIIFENKIYRSLNENNEQITTHLFSYKTQSFLEKEYSFSYTILEKYKTTTTRVFTDILPNYTRIFDMNGIVVDKKYCSLFSYTNANFEDVGIELPFNVFKGKFESANGFTQGYNLYWGGQKINNYYILNGFIETPGTKVDNTQKMIFDKTNSNLNSLIAGFGIAADTNSLVLSRKSFSIDSPIVFVGPTRNTDNYRIIDNFRQISLLNLIISKAEEISLEKENMQNLIFNNSLHWNSQQPAIS